MIDRYKAIEKILEHIQANDLVLSTTGMISRSGLLILSNGVYGGGACK